METPTKARVTVGEIWHLALPTGTKFIAGKAGESRVVEWATTLRAAFPLFGTLGKGHVALAQLELARRLDPRLIPAYLLAELSRAEASALIVDVTISPEDIALADELELPVFLLPPSTDLASVERDILRTLIDREAQLARREMQMRERFQRLLGNSGVQGVLDELTRLTSGYVALRDKSNSSISTAGIPFSASTGRENTFPIKSVGRLLGNLVLHSSSTQLSPLDALYAQQAAEACAVEMLQRQTRQETEERLGLDLVELILDEDQEEKAVASRLLRLGYDISADRQHVVIVLGGNGALLERATHFGDEAYEATTSLVCHSIAHDLQRAAERDDASVLITRHDDQFIVFLSLPRRTRGTTSLAEPLSGDGHRLRAWLQEALANRPKQLPSLGVSRVVNKVNDLCAAMHQAIDAWELGRLIARLESPYYYEQMGLYRLLAELRGRDELRRFYEETLGQLVRYDEEHNTELVHTLEAFFDNNANVSQTSRALYIHRNTLNYRLQRIVEISGLDLNDAESRLALQLALKIHRLSE